MGRQELYSPLYLSDVRNAPNHPHVCGSSSIFYDIQFQVGLHLGTDWVSDNYRTLLEV